MECRYSRSANGNSQSIHREASLENPRTTEAGHGSFSILSDGAFIPTAPVLDSGQPVDHAHTTLQEIDAAALATRHTNRIAQLGGHYVHNGRRVDPPPDYVTLKTTRGQARNTTPSWYASEIEPTNASVLSEANTPKVFQPSSDGLPSYEAAVATRPPISNGSPEIIRRNVSIPETANL
ncbi:hypothetical protein SK128_007689 [Halocaridina rubra]|uniref:Uncharacterized protein n=1 Tax=Halocaridina rubra TaxID=373956 RepID=A0AAN8XKH5_HALRR